MNHLFWKNHIVQQDGANPMGYPAPAAASGLAAAGQRSISAPSSLSDSSRSPLANKYQRAGQRPCMGGAYLDSETGIVGLQDSNARGVASLLVDGAVAASSGHRRMRAAPQFRAPPEQDLRHLPTWNVEDETRKQLRREERERQWQDAKPSMLPSGEDADTLAARRPPLSQRYNDKQQGTISLGWSEAAPTSMIQSGPREEAPWDKQTAFENSRATRRSVPGVDPHRSRVTWDGYGRNDPHAALAEPLGMAREADTDPYAIGNPRAEKVMLRNGPSTRVLQPTGGAQTLDLRDNAYAGQNVQAKSRVRVQDHHNRHSSIQFDHSNPAPTSPSISGHARRPMQTSARQESDEWWNMDKGMKDPPPDPANLRFGKRMDFPAWHHTNASPRLARDDALEPMPVPSQPASTSSGLPPSAVDFINWYRKQYGEDPPAALIEKASALQEQPASSHRGESAAQPMTATTTRSPAARVETTHSPGAGAGAGAGAGTASVPAEAASSDNARQFVDWYRKQYGEDPPAYLIAKAANLGSENTSQPEMTSPVVNPAYASGVPPQSQALRGPEGGSRGEFRAPLKDVNERGHFATAEKKMGSRSNGIGNQAVTINQNNSILGRRSTRVAAPPGGHSSFSFA